MNPGADSGGPAAGATILRVPLRPRPALRPSGSGAEAPSATIIPLRPRPCAAAPAELVLPPLPAPARERLAPPSRPRPVLRPAASGTPPANAAPAPAVVTPEPPLPAALRAPIGQHYEAISEEPGHHERRHRDPETGTIHYLRVRSKTGLKPYEPDQRLAYLFAAEEARHDLIELRLVFEVTLHDPADANRVAEELACGPLDNGVFRTRAKRGSRAWRVSIIPDRWLLDGSGDMWPIDRGTRLKLDLRVRLNPQRCLAHQPTADLATFRARSAREALRVNADRARLLRRVTLDGNDNVLLGVEYFGGQEFHRREERWAEVVSIVLMHLHSLFAAEMEACDVRRVLLAEAYVSRAEVVFELSHPDALNLARDLVPRVRAVSAGAIVREWGATTEEEARPNCVSISAPLADHARMVLYAKTHDRLRVEVRLDDRASQEAERAFPLAREAGITGPHMPLEGVLSVLLRLRRAAARRLHQFWGAMMDVDAPTEPTHEDLAAFMTAMVEAACAGADPRRIIGLLKNGFVTVTEQGGVMPPTVCAVLVQRGILRRARPAVNPPRSGNRQAARYMLSAPYREVLERFKAGWTGEAPRPLRPA